MVKPAEGTTTAGSLEGHSLLNCGWGYMNTRLVYLVVSDKYYWNSIFRKLMRSWHRKLCHSSRYIHINALWTVSVGCECISTSQLDLNKRCQRMLFHVSCGTVFQFRWGSSARKCCRRHGHSTVSEKLEKQELPPTQHINLSRKWANNEQKMKRFSRGDRDTHTHHAFSKRVCELRCLYMSTRMQKACSASVKHCLQSFVRKNTMGKSQFAWQAHETWPCPFSVHRLRWRGGETWLKPSQYSIHQRHIPGGSLQVTANNGTTVLCHGAACGHNHMLSLVLSYLPCLRRQQAKEQTQTHQTHVLLYNLNVQVIIGTCISGEEMSASCLIKNAMESLRCRRQLSWTALHNCRVSSVRRQAETGKRDFRHTSCVSCLRYAVLPARGRKPFHIRQLTWLRRWMGNALRAAC